MAEHTSDILADIVCILVLSDVQKTEIEIFSTFVKLTFQGFEF